jgi:hypothetical protein
MSALADNFVSDRVLFQCHAVFASRQHAARSDQVLTPQNFSNLWTERGVSACEKWHRKEGGLLGDVANLCQEESRVTDVSTRPHSLVRMASELQVLSPLTNSTRWTTHIHE